MKLKDQVCSLELAKKLKELGVKQESLFWWSRHGAGIIPEDEFEVHYQSVITEKNGEPIEYFSAFTVAELGEMLPKMFVWSDGRKAQIATGKSITTDHLVCGIFAGGMNQRVHQVHADTEADARAKCLIYLIENNFIQV
jgi:hypothetical protein